MLGEAKVTAADHDRDRDRAYWDRQAARYDLSMKLLGRPMPRMVQLVEDAARGAAHVLEVAAGTGLVTMAIARSAQHVIATDYADAMVQMLRQRVREAGLSNVTCEPADLYALRYAPASFDAVVAANVLHLVPDLDAALAALKRVLKSGGRLIVPTFAHDETVTSRVVSRLMALTGFPGQRRFTSDSLGGALERAGLRVAKTEIIGGLIPIVYAEGIVS